MEATNKSGDDADKNASEQGEASGQQGATPKVPGQGTALEESGKATDALSAQDAKVGEDHAEADGASPFVGGGDAVDDDMASVEATPATPRAPSVESVEPVETETQSKEVASAEDGTRSKDHSKKDVEVLDRGAVVR